MPESKVKLGSLQVDVDPVLNAGCSFTAADFEPASQEEKASMVVIKKRMSYWQDAWRRLRQNTVAMVALGVIIAITIFAFIGPSFVPYTYSEQIRGSENLSPMTYSEKEIEAMAAGEEVFPHVFGTDTLGRDLLVRVMYGSRISMTVGVTASLIVLVIGSIYGSVSGFIGGKVDDVMMRIVELIYSIPDVLVVLLLQVVLKDPLTELFDTSTSPFIESLSGIGVGLFSIFITFALLYWVGMSRIVRGQVLMLKKQEFVMAAQCLGASNKKIIKRHLLPNCIGQIVVTTCLQIPSAIFLESFLSFLGLGVSAPLASLGSLASDGLGGIYSYAYRLIIPSVVLSVMILSLNLFGDGLRDALDPRLKK
ncbi:MAG TPA: ABC transporter permease [Oscillospiraceae bacterium]|jgi:oligopeptide transport system permease protein|nr:ABC transporter permease [Oscillospiraceae bacterium]HRW56150.1 ABC transporter permease [Oscillospiraceae bacterium]